MAKAIITASYEAQSAWLAGIMDSDGTMGFRVIHNRINPFAGVTNTSEEFLETISQLYPGYTCSIGDSFQLTIYKQLIPEFLRRILPYLIIKKYRAELILKFIDSRSIRKGTSYTQEEIQIFKTYVSLMKKLLPNTNRSAIDRLLKVFEKYERTRLNTYDWLEKLEENKPYTTRDIVKLFGLRYDSTFRILKSLHREGLIQREKRPLLGSGVSSVWIRISREEVIKEK